MRAQNERLVLTLIRQRGAMSKSEIARITGLSAQTVSVIMRSLEDEGLLLKGAPQRGKVGQPSVPMRLNPEGAFFFGLKIGRRSVELILTDFLGSIVAHEKQVYPYPEFASTLAFATSAVSKIEDTLTTKNAARIAGIGIAIPFRLWDWPRIAGFEADKMEDWRSHNIQSEIAERVDFPVFLQNDATSACSAELVFGTQALPANFLHFYVATFIGGGVVLNGSLFPGPSGNAGAVGPMLVPDQKGQQHQLLDLASLVALENMLVAADLDPSSLWTEPEEWKIPPTLRQEWISQAGTSIARAAHAAVAVIDFEAICIDGWMPALLRDGLIAQIIRTFEDLNFTGLERPDVIAGTVGTDARALGAASQPLLGRFLLPFTH